MMRKSARLLWRGGCRMLGALFCLVALLWLLVIALAATAPGSRWLVARLLALQSVVRFEVSGGTLRDGLTVRGLQVKTRKFRVLADEVFLRVRWAGLLAGDLYVESLQARSARVVYDHPPIPGPVHLKPLTIPIRLTMESGCLEGAAIIRTTGTTAVDRLCVSGAVWRGDLARIGEAALDHPGFQARAAGDIRFVANYPVRATGLLAAPLLARHDLKPVSVMAGGDLAGLVLRVRAGRDHPTLMAGSVDTLVHELPFHGVLRWGKQSVSWLPDLGLQTRDGVAYFRGDRGGLKARVDTDLAGPYFPPGRYQAAVQTDWHSLQFRPLEARTALGGVVRVTGRLGWGHGLDWGLQSEWRDADLSRQWPALQSAIPPLNGRLDTEGHAAATGSWVRLSAGWNNGERWTGRLESAGMPWHADQWRSVILGWSNVQRVLPGLPDARSDNGSLTLNGPLVGGRFALDARFGATGLPEGRWQAGGQTARTRIDFTGLHYDGAAGGLDGLGVLDWGQGLHASGRLVLREFRSDRWTPGWPARVSGPLTLDGRWSKEIRQLDMTGVALTGDLREKPLAVSGALSIQQSASGGLPDLQGHQVRLDWGLDSLELEGGRHRDGWDLTANTVLADLSQFDSRLGGEVSGVVRLQGERERPTAIVNLGGEHLRAADLALESFNLSGMVPALAEENGFLQLHAHRGARGDRELRDMTLVVEGSRSAHRISWQTDSGQVLAEGVLQGSVDDRLDWEGISEASAVHMRDFLWLQEQPFAIRWRRGERALSADPQCWTAESARLCSEDILTASPTAAHARLTLGGLDIDRMSAVFPEGLAWRGSLDGNAALDWAAGKPPVLTGKLVTRHGAIGLSQDDEDEPLTLPYDELSLSLATEGERLHARFDTAAPNIGQGYVDTWINPASTPYAINGALVLEKVNVAVLKPFFPGLSRFEGELNLAGGLSGPVDSPDFYGNFAFRNGALAARDAPIDLDHIELGAEIRGRQATLTGGFHSGEGEAKLDGGLAWSGTPQLDLHLGGQGLVVRQKPLVNLLADPDIRIQVQPYHLSVNGQVDIPEGEIQPQALSDKAIPLSTDVRVIDDNARSRVKVAGAMQKWAIDADVSLVLGNKVRFKGFGLSSYMNGRLRLQEKPQRGLQANGEIDIDTRADRDARYEAYGQKLAIRTGRLLFAGPLTQPAINMEAIKTVDDKVVGVRVEGRANAPRVQLFSDSAMTQDEMLGYLLIGRPLYQEGRLNVGSTGSDASLLASAALGLGIRGGQGIASDIGNVVGIRDVALDAEGSGDTTRFTVSGYLSPQLYLRYGVGVFTPVNKLTLRYKINSNLYLEAVSSLESALDLFYNFKFD